MRVFDGVTKMEYKSFRIGTLFSDNFMQYNESSLALKKIIEDTKESLGDSFSHYSIRQKDLIPKSRIIKGELNDIFRKTNKVQALVLDLTDRNPMINFTFGLISAIAPLEDWDYSIFFIHKHSSSTFDGGFYTCIPSILQNVIKVDTVHFYDIKDGEITFHNEDRYEIMIEDLSLEIVEQCG